MKVGEQGISARLMSKHVYNETCTLFHKPDFLEVKSFVKLYFQKHSRSRNPIIESTGKRGYYRLSKNGISHACQQFIEFHEEDFRNF